MNGVEVSVIPCFINSYQCQPMHPSLVFEGQSCVYHSQCVLVSLISLSVLACLAKCGALCEAFRVWNGFGNDVIVEQQSHPCLVVPNTVCYFTLCVLSSSGSQLQQCVFYLLFILKGKDHTITKNLQVLSLMCQLIVYCTLKKRKKACGFFPSFILTCEEKGVYSGMKKKG